MKFYDENSVYFRRLVASKLHRPLKDLEVEDVNFTAWAEIFKSWDSYKGNGSRMHWAAVILFRVVQRHIRKNIREREMKSMYYRSAGIEEEGPLLKNIETMSRDFNHTLVEYNLLDFHKIRDMLELTDIEIRTLQYLIDELEYTEMAEREGCRKNIMRKRVSRLRKKLSRVFDDAPLDPDNVI